MTDKTDTDPDIEILPPDTIAAMDDEASGPAPEGGVDTRRIPRLPLIFGAGILTGLALAAVIVWQLRPAPFDDSQLRGQIAMLDEQIAAVASRPQAAPLDTRPLTRRLEAQAQRLESNEARLSEIDKALTELAADMDVDMAPIYSELVTRLETLQENGFEIPEDFAFQGAAEPVDLSGIETRLNRLEAGLSAAQSNLEERQASTAALSNDLTLPEPNIDLSRLSRFPADRLRQAADELSGEGLVKRFFSQHVRIRGEANPRILIGRVESHLENDRPRAALSNFEQLPEAMQSLARAWEAELRQAIDQADGVNP